MNKFNEKFNKECIAQALIILMNEKDFKSISITEITEKAGVSRMTYYRNYNYKEDIINDYINSLLEQYNSTRKEYVDSIYNRFLFAYNFFKDNKNFIINMEKSKLSGIIQNKINEYMNNFYPNSKSDIKEQYCSYLLSGALYNSAKMWILNDTKETPEELATIFVERLFK